MHIVGNISSDELHIDGVSVFTNDVKIAARVFCQSCWPANQHSLHGRLSLDNFTIQNRFDDMLAIKPFFESVHCRVAFDEIVATPDPFANRFKIQ